MELPGRGLRAKEKPYADMEELIENVYSRVCEIKKDSDFAFFGHSFGVLILFELCKRIAADNGKKPEFIFVLGNRPPCLTAEHFYGHLSDEEFMNDLISFGGINEILAQNREAMKYFLGIIRSDFNIIERFDCQKPDAPFDFDIYAFGGLDDNTFTRDLIYEWENYTTKNCRIELYEGDHFFIDANSDRIAAVMNTAAAEKRG
jgi:surfactin synthase thioesterase subunit